jgi:hypothetical protein
MDYASAAHKVTTASHRSSLDRVVQLLASQFKWDTINTDHRTRHSFAHPVSDCWFAAAQLHTFLLMNLGITVYLTRYQSKFKTSKSKLLSDLFLYWMPYVQASTGWRSLQTVALRRLIKLIVKEKLVPHIWSTPALVLSESITIPGVDRKTTLQL